MNKFFYVMSQMLANQMVIMNSLYMLLVREQNRQAPGSIEYRTIDGMMDDIREGLSYSRQIVDEVKNGKEKTR